MEEPLQPGFAGIRLPKNSSRGDAERQQQHEATTDQDGAEQQEQSAGQQEQQQQPGDEQLAKDEVASDAETVTMGSPGNAATGV